MTNQPLTRDKVAEIVAKRAGWVWRHTYSIAAAGPVKYEEKWEETSTEVRNQALKVADEILEAVLNQPAEGG